MVCTKEVVELIFFLSPCDGDGRGRRNEDALLYAIASARFFLVNAIRTGSFV